MPFAYEMVIEEGRPKRKKFPKRDQFGAELEYFSDCILHDREPEPSGVEGLADVRVIQAILKSAAIGRPIELPPFQRIRRPNKRQQIKKPAVQKPELVHASSPSGT